MSKMTKLEKAERVVELQRWIEGAQKELAEYEEWDRPLKFEVEQCSHRFRCHYINPTALSEHAQARLQKYFKRMIRDEIKAAEAERDALL